MVTNNKSLQLPTLSVSSIKDVTQTVPKKKFHFGFSYSYFLFESPLIILLLAFLLFGCAPFVILYHYPLKIDSNPEKGFDTRETQYSGPRLAWAELQPSLLQGSRILIDVVNKTNLLTDLSEKNDRLKRNTFHEINVWQQKQKDISEPKIINNVTLLMINNQQQNKIFTKLKNKITNNLTLIYNKNIVKRSWAEDLIASFSSVACYDQPIPAMNYLSQLIITVPTYEDMYSLKFLSELCDLHLKLSESIHKFDQFTPYRNIWHVANYFACLAPESRVNCSYLTLNDVQSVRFDIEVCATHRKSIINCRKSCERHESLMQEIHNAETKIQCESSCKNKEGVPQQCASQMMTDLFYRILPKDLTTEPMNLNVFLPFYTFSSYRMQGYDVGISTYTLFENKILNEAKKSVSFKLKGMLLDIKRDILFKAAISDSKFSLIAGISVFVLIGLYTISFSYSFVVLLQLALSVTSALAVYRIFNDEFPLLNLIVFVLLISIGSDGAFLLFSGFPSPETLNVITFHKCLKHTATTMFLTQFSTVVPFFLNILSSVIAFRNFGLFAGLTLITNYFLLISFLPAFLVIQFRYLNPWLVRHLPSSLWYCFPTFSYSPNLSITNTIKRQQLTNINTSNDNNKNNNDTLINKIVVEEQQRSYLEQLCANMQSLFHEVLPMVLIQGRFVWIFSLTIVIIITTIICITQLRLPQYNPLQLFVNSNPHEFYDNFAEKTFYFVSSKIALPLSLRLVWGINTVHTQNHFDPNYLSNLSANADFSLTNARQLQKLAAQLRHFRTLPFIQHPYKFWPERYLDWSKKLVCHDSESVCCNIESPYYLDTYIDYCMRVSTAQLQTQYNDTPIYHNITFELLGYTALLPTQLKYSHRYTNLLNSFVKFDKEFQSNIPELPMWYTTEWHLMSTWFDLQRSIIADCKQSVIVSSLVVFIFSASVLRWKCIYAIITIPSIIISTTGVVVFFGWEIGVLEGVILVLVVGLSFDYTLHYGAAIPTSGCIMHRVKVSVQKATLPVMMAALSSIIAGSVMLFAQTHAFYQVAVFLVVSTTMSFLFATFFFLPLFYVFTPLKLSYTCQLCNLLTNSKHLQASNYPLGPIRKEPSYSHT